MDFKLTSSAENKSSRRTLKKLYSSKAHSHLKKVRKRKINMNEKFIESHPKVFGHSFVRSQSSSKHPGKKTLHLCHRKKLNNESGDSGITRTDKRRRRRRKKKKNVVQDEVSCLQRRVRYLLIKMKLEHNLIDAYSGDGWKGQSKEKIKPEKELQRAMKQILKCKHGIRDTIHQMDILSTEGCIGDSLMSPDGSVFHEHICAKCKSSEAFPDNDIILCDGTCNCGFHQKCLEPPLEHIPPADQGWLCKICECRMETLEAINAHIGTSFTMNSSWEDIFEEATTSLSTENASQNPDEEWPSEDSNDEDYHPEISNSRTGIEESMSDDSSSSTLFCSSDEVSTSHEFTKYDGWDVKNKEELELLDSIVDIDSGEASDREITNYRRQRRNVDYKKLHDEMFGKDFNDNEQQSEDEDWGPQRRKQRRDLEVDTTMDNYGEENGCTNMVLHENISCARRKLFRIPQDAVEKLRQVFSQNELPSRAIRENLSQELGISAEKITKWFKNARYAALKLRKADMTNPPEMVGSTTKSGDAGKQNLDDEVESMDSSYLLPLSSFIRVRRNLRKILKRENSAITDPLKKRHKEAVNELSSDKIQRLRNVFMEHQLPSVLVQKNLAKELDLSYYQVSTWFKDAMEVSGVESKSLLEGVVPQIDEITEDEKICLREIERLFDLEDRIQKLKNTLLTCRDDGQVPSKTHPREQNVMYVPVVEIREKVMQVQLPIRP